MEWVLLFAMVCGFSSLSSKIKMLSLQVSNDRKGNAKDKKLLSSLDNLVGKKVEIEDDEHYYENEDKGILKYYDDTWIAIESFNKKNKREVNYFRIANISAINIIEDK